MDHKKLTDFFLEEFESEVPATLKCLERIPGDLFDWKPHKKSMTMGYLGLLVAEIPKWITLMIEKSEIDFITFKHYEPSSTEELVTHFKENLEGARSALKNLTDKALTESFHLKNNGVILFSSPLDASLASTINHWVHHRGQLTVYMRLNDIPVPSIYGPSADDKSF